MSAYFNAVVYNAVYSACLLNAALTNSVCLNNASFFFLFKYFLCQGYELSGEIALKNNHYYYYIKRPRDKITAWFNSVFHIPLLARHSDNVHDVSALYFNYDYHVI